MHFHSKNDPSQSKNQITNVSFQSFQDPFLAGYLTAVNFRGAFHPPEFRNPAEFLTPRVCKSLPCALQLLELLVPRHLQTSSRKRHNKNAGWLGNQHQVAKTDLNETVLIDHEYHKVPYGTMLDVTPLPGNTQERHIYIFIYTSMYMLDARYAKLLKLCDIQAWMTSNKRIWEDMSGYERVWLDALKHLNMQPAQRSRPTWSHSNSMMHIICSKFREYNLIIMRNCHSWSNKCF